ncbi:annexin A13-like [Antedon mediterranea]|uniref:annexin A13-like n=1 Tax=Antedon mediterranea TaxID=105859 RepID=UPI003AF62AB5
MRERLLIRDKHLAAFGYTLSEFLINVTSHDTHACINVLLESTTQSTTRLLNDLSSGTFDVESILEVIIPLSNQEMLTVQDSYMEEYNRSLETVVLNSEMDTAVKRLLGSLLLGMRAESKVVSISQINKDVNRILEGDDIDVQSVLAIRSLEDINTIYEEFTLSNSDLTEFLFDQSEDIYIMGYVKIVSYGRSTTDYWAAVFNRLIHVTPSSSNHFTRILVQRAEIDLNGITQRYQELYGRSLEDDVINNYSGPCKEQAITTINHQFIHA